MHKVKLIVKIITQIFKLKTEIIITNRIVYGMSRKD
jgi:hypothetical protein